MESDALIPSMHVSPLQEPSHPPRGFKPGSVGAIVGSFKLSVTRRLGRELNTGNIWQRNYYERIAGTILENQLKWDQDEENPHNQPG